LLDKLTVTVLAEDSVPYESPLLGQHGVSFWLEAERNGITKRVLVDVGQNPEALLFNVGKLGIPLREADAVVLTHCHYDHTQGLTRILEAIGRKNVPVIAHPALFRLNFVTDPFFQHVGVMQGDRAEDLRAAGAELVLVSGPLQLMPGLSTTGEVPRVTDFEEVGIALSTLDENGRVVPDSMPDDLSLAARIEGKGLALVTGCSHAGIINILRHVLTPGEKLEAVIGGLHLVEAPDERIEKTVEALAGYSPSLVAAGHCTGFRAQAALYRVLGKRFTPLGSGAVFRFS
jgi:7,8-dihydropterin-6-yl-methyl-4-(beta-D-ribofuranosyl)aminobenzene 5'-phosphate synthase